MRERLPRALEGGRPSPVPAAAPATAPLEEEKMRL